MTRIEALRRKRIKEMVRRVDKSAPQLHLALISLFRSIDGNGVPARYQPIVNGFVEPPVDSVRVNIPSTDVRLWRELLDDIHSGYKEVDEVTP